MQLSKRRINILPARADVESLSRQIRTYMITSRKVISALIKTVTNRLRQMISNQISLIPVLGLLLFVGCHEKAEKPVPQTSSYAIRLKPGEDLKKSIQEFVDTKQIEAGWIASCAGSLTSYHIRFANMPEGSRASGHFEIVSLSGTLSTHGSHLHISVSDRTGRTIGGHLMDDCIVYTTAEIVIQSSANLLFTRENDGTTQWKELQIKEK